MKLQTVSVACCKVLALAFTVLAQQDQASTRSTDRIIREVRHELVMLPYLGLVGQVTRPTLKSDAENVIKRIEGVKHVDNQIEVLPPSPIDESLRRQLYRAIYGYSALQKYAIGVQQPIRIIVKGGKVTLEGVVDNEGDKNTANIQANGVPGVFSVTNNLQIVKN